MNIDVPTARNLLSAVVREFGPDHVATSENGTGCTYLDSTVNFVKPVCIVGQVMHRLGILGLWIGDQAVHAVTEFDASAAHDAQPETCHVDSYAWGRVAEAGFDFDEDARQFLRDAQEVQDGGLDWGHALSEAVGRHNARVTNRRNQAVEAATREVKAEFASQYLDEPDLG